ncbi:hypothetical protein BDU57DRAFT_540724 [Ampelomyces quisqualis]|uniref:Uncharacterized protein n=1 Tax=Ampelomyces quisqualis TaxID=50730 RepID=A0A6A5QK52_AMPQU|nr:hypothetical protein BDU57DRAFT_540724 [Ampelomyces quisqualis]
MQRTNKWIKSHSKVPLSWTEELDDESDDSSNGEIKIVISSDPATSNESRSTAITAENGNGNSESLYGLEAAPNAFKPKHIDRKAIQSQNKLKKRKKQQRHLSLPEPTPEEVEAAKNLKAQHKREFEEKGYTIGKHDAPLRPETYELIAEDNLYFGKGC